MVKIIQMSIILTYDVTGKLWEMPKNLTNILLFEIRKTNWYLQCGNDQQYGEVDLDDHVDVILGEDPRDEADHLKSNGGNENCQSVADKRSSKSDLNHNRILSPNLGIAHSKLSYEISIEGNVSVVIQTLWHDRCEICVKRELHDTNLGVKWILVHVVVTDELHRPLLG